MDHETDYRVKTRRDGDVVEIAVEGRIDLDNAARVLAEILRGAGPGPCSARLDLSAVDYFDSGGLAMVLRLERELRSRGGQLLLGGATPQVLAMLELVDRDALTREPAAPVPTPPLPTRLGGLVLDFVRDCREMIAFTGEMAMGVLEALRYPHRVRWADTWRYMERAGVDALPIVTLISFLMGLIMAFQAAVQMSQFGADIYVANLVGLALVRELAPLMTAIIVSGRSGAAFAAEIGTMKVSEEVDALEVMGLDRARFLVTPKLLALVAMLPCLVLFADLIGIAGGLTVSTLWLGLPPEVYIRQTQRALGAWDVYSGLVKALAFAILIGAAGCLRGFQVRGGADSVGRQTTSAVVSGIFLIIAADAVFTILFHYW